MPKLEARTGYLSMLGNVATLCGLLGTVSGLITCFAAVASVAAEQKSQVLSQGIAEAMNCTAFGLLVAIPSLVAYASYQNRTDTLVQSLTESVTRIYHDLVFMTESTQVSSTKSAFGATKAQSVAPAPTVSM
jgi:biopolymer transport protein ExbB/TolQ